MEIQTQLVNYTAELIRNFGAVSIGPALPQAGIAVQIVSGARDDLYYSGAARKHLTLQLLCKDKDHQQTYDLLCRVCNYLGALRDFTGQDAYQVLGYDIQTEPQFVCLEHPGGMSVYTAIIYVNYYDRSDQNV